MEGQRESTSPLCNEVQQFSKGCEHLLSALARHTKFSEIEKGVISYYCQEITTQMKSLLEEREEV